MKKTTASEDNVISDQYKIGAYFYDVIVLFFQLFVGGVSKWRNSFIKLINPLPNEKIVELCCGTGSVSLRVSKIIKRKVWASDLSPDQVKVSIFKAKLLRRDIEFSVQDASNTSYPSSFFDKVIISGALHEIKKKRRLSIYSEVKRLLGGNGYFFVSEPDLPEKGWVKESFDFIFGKWNPEHDTAYELINNGLENEQAVAGFLFEESCTSNFGTSKSRKFKVIKQ